MHNYPDQRDLELIRAINLLKNEAEITTFLRDILTLSEIREASMRFQIAKTLWTTNKSYLEIAAEFKTSTTTVTRVADWLNHQPYGGYRTILERLYPKK